MINNVEVTTRGPGGPMQPQDYAWVRAMRAEGAHLKVIASYFDPQPPTDEVRAVLRGKGGT